MQVAAGAFQGAPVPATGIPGVAQQAEAPQQQQPMGGAMNPADLAAGGGLSI